MSFKCIECSSVHHHRRSHSCFSVHGRTHNKIVGAMNDWNETEEPFR